jgi:hypothetical protein
MHFAIGIKVSGQSQIHPNPLCQHDHPTTFHALENDMSCSLRAEGDQLNLLQ